MKLWLAFAVGLAGGLAFHVQATKEIRAESADRIATLEASVGSGCEPIFAVIYSEEKCPPFVGSASDAARSVVCSKEIAWYRSADIGDALEQLGSLGPGVGAVLLEEKGIKERQLPIRWIPHTRGDRR